MLIRPANAQAEHVRAFCAAVCAESSPIEVLSRPIPGVPINECFTILPGYVSQFGGGQEIGWAIWERPGVFIEAEFHTIWRAPDGERIDVMPHPIWCTSITFLPDPGRMFQGRALDNIRRPLVQDRDVNRFLYLATRRIELLQRAPLALDVDRSPAGRRRLAEYTDIIRELGQLERRIDRRYPEPATLATQDGLRGPPNTAYMADPG